MPDSSELLTVVWFDPGAFTGWAIVRVRPTYLNPYFSGDPPSLVEHMASWNCGTFIDAAGANMDAMVSMILRWPSAVVGTEDFTLRAPHLSGRESVSPIGINYALEHVVCRRLGRRLWYQMPGVKDNYPPSRLQAVGLWRVGMGTKVGKHGQEAFSHAINWLKEAVNTPAYREALLDEPR